MYRPRPWNPKQLLLKLGVFLLLAVLVGCRTSETHSSPDPVQANAALDDHRLEQIKTGMALAELKSAQQQSAKAYPHSKLLPLSHHFTIQAADGRIEVVSGTIVAPMPFVFVFRDDRLAEIIDPKLQTVYALQNPSDAHEMSRTIMSDPHLSNKEFQDAVKIRSQQRAIHEAFTEPVPFAGVWYEVSGMRATRAEYLRLLARFDGSKAVIGAPIDEIDGVYGPPAWAGETADGTHLRIYGEERQLEPFANPRIFATFVDGNLVEVVTRCNVPLMPVTTHRTYEVESSSP